MSLEQLLKNLAGRVLSPSAVRRVKGVARPVWIWWYRNDLDEIARLCRTDKWGAHWFTQHYDRYFRPMKSRRLNVLEIGVGGYDSPEDGGCSLRMWKAYFRKSQIVGIDLYDKTHFSERRIDVRQCDQTDKEGLIRLSRE